MDPAESAVVQAALSRGFVSATQLAEAKAAALQSGAPGAILSVLSERYLTPPQREELRAVWREASGHEATRADTASSGVDATLPPPGAGAPGFDTAGATLLSDAAGKAPTAHFLPSGRSASGRFDPTTATLVEGPTPGFDPRGATLQPAPGPPAQPGYDATAATIIEPAGVPSPPPPPPHDDFRSANTLVEAAPPPQDDFRSANTLVEPGPPRPETTGSLKPEQTEVARRQGEGHTRSDDPRSAPPLSGVSPSLMTRGALDQRAKPARTLPERIGGYRPTRELGRGGMGVVYEALDAADRRVALKVLLGGISASEQAVQRFLIEGKATARMKHKNIVELLYLSEKPDEEGRWYLAMELVRGGSLKERVDKQGPLEEREAARITIQLADALAFAHGQNVLHRDIKPHNVLLDENGVPKLTDFGLAKLVGDHQHSLTASGPSVMGTPGFMPPEQAGASNDPPDQRADVYSLGATLFHMLTGRAPFQDDSVARVLMAVVKSPPPLISTFRTDVSRDLETIVLKCLEKRPGDRYQSAAELRDDLTRLIEEQEIVARRVSGVTRLARWISANLAASVGILLGSAAALTLGAREVRRALEPPPPPPVIRNGNGGNGGRGWGTAPPGTGAVPGSGSVAWQGTAPVGTFDISQLDTKALAQITSRDLVKPQLRVMEPKPRQLVNKPSVAVRVFASDEGGVSGVALLGGNALKQDPDTPDVYMGRWDLGAGDGVKRIAVRVEDEAGNSSQDELIVIVDRGIPTLELEQSPAGVLEGETWQVVETQVVPRTKVTLRVQASEPVTVEATLPEGKRLLSEGARQQAHALAVELEEEKPVTVQLVARDEAGNTSAPVFRRLERVRAPWLAGAWWPLLDEQRRAARDGRPVWFKNRLGMRFALVPPGKFQRGGKEVAISRELYFAETEVTNAQLRAVLDHRGPPGLGGDDQPAVGIDRARVNEYLAALNREHAQVGGLQVEYRLPTEAEWELACRGFRAAAWWEPLERYAWAEKALSVPTSPVRELQPNPLGLYDLLGNAEEWCQDYFAQTVPDGVDPARADETRPSFVAKGGSWRRKSGSGDKSPFRPEWRFAWSKEGNEVLGFRVVAAPR